MFQPLTVAIIARIIVSLTPLRLAMPVLIANTAQAEDDSDGGLLNMNDKLV